MTEVGLFLGKAMPQVALHLGSATWTTHDPSGFVSWLSPNLVPTQRSFPGYG